MAGKNGRNGHQQSLGLELAPAPLGKADLKPAEDLANVFCDPIIVWPGGWGDSLPPEIKKQITMQRLLRLARGAKHPEEMDLATDAEIASYMFTVTLCQPVDNEWVRIYMFIMTRFMGEKFPEDMRVTELGQYEESMLRDLQRFIVRQQVKHRAEMRRAERSEVKKVSEVQEVKKVMPDAQMAIAFDFK